MNCFGRFATLGALTVLVGVPALAQQGGTGQQPQNPGGQVGRGTAAQPGYVFGGVNQAPWFRDPTIRTQLRINDDQFNRLNTAYGQQWNRYHTAQGRFGDLNEQERARRMQELSGAFYKDYGLAANDVLQPDQRQRFNQLWLQYRGYSAFNDPTVQQQLRLNERQLDELRRYDLDYHTRMSDIYRGMGTDRTGSTTRFNDLRKNMDERINKVLTEEQRKNWRELAGDPYAFQPLTDSLKPVPPNARPGKPGK